MKVEELFETTSVGGTSVGNIGTVEYAAFGNRVDLFKRNKSTVTHIARIKRNKGDGWRFTTTDGWGNCNLPHFGNTYNTKLHLNGSKTISSNLSKLLKGWGINHDNVKRLW